MPDPQAAAFTAAMYRAFENRRSLPDGQRLTLSMIRVGTRLAYGPHLQRKHRDLAVAARVSPRTVARALQTLRALGLLSWTRRVLRAADWRGQIANAYQLLSRQPVSFLVLRTSAKLARPSPLDARLPAAGDLLRHSQARIEAEMLRRRGLLAPKPC